MKISDNGKKLIIEFEGFRNDTYDDGFGNLTIGIGHCANDVYKGEHLTDREVYALFYNDIARFEENVNKYDYKYNWTQNEFDALVSFAFNIGSIDELVRYGDLSKSEIPARMLLYCHAGAEVVEGLQVRREKEVELYKTPVAKTKDISYYFNLIAETLLGSFGNGDEREKKLGDDYKIIQESINVLYDYLNKNI